MNKNHSQNFMRRFFVGIKTTQSINKNLLFSYAFYAFSLISILVHRIKSLNEHFGLDSKEEILRSSRRFSHSFRFLIIKSQIPTIIYKTKLIHNPLSRDFSEAFSPVIKSFLSNCRLKYHKLSKFL